MIVFSAARVGSHSTRDWLRLHGHPEAFVLHAACLDNGHLLPEGAVVYDDEKDPENLGGDNLVLAQRIRSGSGVEMVVPVRNPVDRAVSAWRYFRKGKGPIGDVSLYDGWWRRQYSRWAGPHRVAVFRIEDGADALGTKLGLERWAPMERRQQATVDAVPEFTDSDVRDLREGFVARTFYTADEIEEALCRWTAR